MVRVCSDGSEEWAGAAEGVRAEVSREQGCVARVLTGGDCGAGFIGWRRGAIVRQVYPGSERRAGEDAGARVER